MMIAAPLHQLGNEELMTQLVLHHDLSTLEQELLDRLLSVSLALQQTCTELAEIRQRAADLEK